MIFWKRNYRLAFICCCAQFFVASSFSFFSKTCRLYGCLLGLFFQSLDTALLSIEIPARTSIRRFRPAQCCQITQPFKQQIQSFVTLFIKHKAIQSNCVLSTKKSARDGLIKILSNTYLINRKKKSDANLRSGNVILNHRDFVSIGHNGLNKRLGGIYCLLLKFALIIYNINRPLETWVAALRLFVVGISFLFLVSHKSHE